MSDLRYLSDAERQAYQRATEALSYLRAAITQLNEKQPDQALHTLKEVRLHLVDLTGDLELAMLNRSEARSPMSQQPQKRRLQEALILEAYRALGALRDANHDCAEDLEQALEAMVAEPTP